MNGCCDCYHPLQALADLQTIQETFGRLEGIRLLGQVVKRDGANRRVLTGPQ